MIGKTINSTKHVTLAKAKEILRQRGKDGDLLYEQVGSLAYCEKFAKISEKEAQQLVDDVVELGVSEESAIKVADIIPRFKSQLAAILAKENPEISQDKQDKIFDILAPYQEKAQEHAKKVAEQKIADDAAKAAAEAKAQAAAEEAAKEEPKKEKEEKEEAPATEEAKPKKERKSKKAEKT